MVFGGLYSTQNTWGTIIINSTNHQLRSKAFDSCIKKFIKSYADLIKNFVLVTSVTKTFIYLLIF